MTTDMTTALLLAQAATAPPASGARLVVAALVGIALIVVLITRFKLHPFLALTIGSLVVAGIAGLPVAAAITGYLKGFGDTAAGVGTLIALGAMFGKLLADSGGGDQIVDTIIGRSSTRTLPWAMAAVGALIGLPMFFEIGLVLLMPVIFLVARRSGLSLIKVGIPALAGLSVMHGLVPPHPGPLVAIAALNANLGITLALRRPHRHPDGRDRRPAVRPLRRPLGRRPRSAPVRRRARPRTHRRRQPRSRRTVG